MKKWMEQSHFNQDKRENVITFLWKLHLEVNFLILSKKVNFSDKVNFLKVLLECISKN